MTKEDVDEAIKDFENMKKGIFPWDCSGLCDIAISALKGEAFNEKSYKDGFNDGYSQGKEKAETKAYFDGQAYGWEEGRKDLCDKISAEINEKAFTEEIFDEDVFRSTYTENTTREEAEDESVIETEIVKLSDILEIIEKYKGASE